MKHRTRQHKSIQQGDRYTNGISGGDVLEQAAGRRAMQVQKIVFASVNRGNHVGLPINGEAYVTNYCLVYNVINGFSLVIAAFWHTANLIYGRFFKIRHNILPS